MSEGQDDSTEKPYDPSPKRLEDLRRKGDVPRSTDLTATACYAGFLIAVVVVGPAAVEKAGTAMMKTIERPEALAPLFLDGGSALMGGFMGTLVIALTPLFLIPAGLVIAAVFAQNAFTVTPDKVRPKLNRISPLANLKNKFGRAGLFEFAKSFVKLVLISLVLWFFLVGQIDDMLVAALTGARPATLAMAEIAVRFMTVVVGISLLIGAVDFLWQRAEFTRRNRMSHKDVTDESKQTEGDPALKQKRRQKGYDIATNRMMTDVPDADVVIVNPEHYAVALKWSRRRGEAPVCVAKGVDEVAARIREVGREAGVPLHRDPPTARALHATTDIGAQIDPAHYRAVAAAIRFADRMRAHRRRRGPDET